MSDVMQLNSAQLEAIGEIDRNLQIIACAGSGKTEVIARRIANILRSKPDIQPKNIVAFTFTEKAAASMKIRIANALGTLPRDAVDRMYIGTIHGFCFHLLKAYTERFQKTKVLDSVKNYLFISRYHKECGMKDLGLDFCPSNVDLFLQCIEKMTDDYDQAASWASLQQEAFQKYASCLYAHGYIDFTRMVFEALRQIESNPVVAQYLSRIKYLIVDEYQDVNDLQEQLIHRIAVAGANVCVVGDDDQTIYQFRGSNADNMITFSQRYADVHQVRLKKNYRCAPEIVAIADEVISHNQHRIPKAMVAAERGKTARIEAIRYANKDEQYTAIAEKVVSLHKTGIPYREIAILVRKGKVIAPVSAALEAAGVPIDADSAEYFFNGNYFWRFSATLQQIVDGVERSKLSEIWGGIADRAAIQAGFRFLRRCTECGKPRLSSIIDEFCAKISFADAAAEDSKDRRVALEAMKTILDDYDEIYGDWQVSRRITGVLKFLETQAAEEYKYHSFQEEDPCVDAVHVMTVHKAKGLEFDTVFLPELMKREFPVANSGGRKYWHVLGGTFAGNKDKYQGDLEDERKLFYVAVTRAKRNLYMSYELSSQPVSCFVREAAGSAYLKIDRGDLDYDPKECSEDAFEAERSNRKSGQPLSTDREEKRRERECWEDVKYARRQLYDYYGTASRCCPGAYGDLIRIKSMSPDEILAEARRNRLI